MVDSKHIEKSENLITWLVRFIGRLSYTSSDRANVAATCLDVAMEHHRSIVLTTSATYYGSAFALVRLEFEAYIRGIWLFNCASDDEVGKYKISDRFDRKIDAMIDDLEALPAFDDAVLSKIKRESWKEMNSFVHTGRLQMIRRLTATEIAPNYPEEEIIGMLDHAGCVALLAALAILRLTMGEVTDEEQLAVDLVDRLTEFVRTD